MLRSHYKYLENTSKTEKIKSSYHLYREIFLHKKQFPTTIENPGSLFGFIGVLIFVTIFSMFSYLLIYNWAVGGQEWKCLDSYHKGKGLVKITLSLFLISVVSTFMWLAHERAKRRHKRWIDNKFIDFEEQLKETVN